ncbi:MAG: SPOR domain-containing protein [Robiginitomaculum sp.]|nr:SPOR domain-containing protein [Robiginitomaculum sp.]
MTEHDRGVYSPPPNEYDRFDVSDEDDTRRGPLLLVVVIAVAIAFIAVVYTAYHQGFRTGGRNAAPIIEANSNPIKSAPKDPGGTPPAESNSAAYEPLDGNTTPNEIIEAPKPEQPIERQPIAEPVPEPVAQAPAPARVDPAPIARPSFDIERTGKFVVQLGAFRSEAQATENWTTLRNRLPAMMGNTQIDVQRADLGAKGIYYRLRAAAFGERAGAVDFCNALKANGQDCIVVSR